MPDGMKRGAGVEGGGHTSHRRGDKIENGRPYRRGQALGQADAGVGRLIGRGSEGSNKARGGRREGQREGGMGRERWKGGRVEGWKVERWECAGVRWSAGERTGVLRGARQAGRGMAGWGPGSA